MNAQPTPQRRGRRLLAALALLTATVGTGFGAWLYWLYVVPQPVVTTNLEHEGIMKLVRGPGWRDLPFRLTPEEEFAVDECAVLGGAIARARGVGPPEFDAESVRKKLERLLAQHPDLFHAESMMAFWHRRQGNEAEADSHTRRAQELAPVVLVQRFEHPDGTPLVGALIQRCQVECNRIQNGSLDPSLQLTFFGLTTDDNGCIRLPVYRTVYRLHGISHPAGFSVELPPLGWFEARGKVGLMPAATVRRER